MLFIATKHLQQTKQADCLSVRLGTESEGSAYIFEILQRAVEFLELMKKDPKNRYRIGELDCCINELQDYLMGENIYNTTEEQLIKYYDAKNRMA